MRRKDAEQFIIIEVEFLFIIVSNLNFLGVNFVGIIFFKTPMCHDFATKLNLQDLNIVKAAFFSAGSIQISNQFMYDFCEILYA